MRKKERTLTSAAAKAGMDEKTARRYLLLDKLPSEVKPERSWRTRPDAFEEVWEDLERKLELHPQLEAKTLFEYLQREYPRRFDDGQLRTLQRRIKVWRALEGPAKEVMFAQVHRPGQLCQSDFTYMNKLGVTIAGERFDHLLYHFVLTYSDWESATICYSESFESLSAGLQSALWELGAAPTAHQTDRMSTAVQKTDHPEEFTPRYLALLRHYRMAARTIQAGRPNENGDVEQRHYRFKRVLEQQLMLRGSRDFASRQHYLAFVQQLIDQLNRGRRHRLQEELKVMRRLPLGRLDAFQRLQVRVAAGSTISVARNTYSVHSRLIGEQVSVRLHADELEVWYAQRCLERIPRLRGEGRHRVQYRHIIDWLVRKPGAFENYRYREDLFPSSRFRIAYDQLKGHHSMRGAAKQYLLILQLAAKVSEDLVDQALRQLLDRGTNINIEQVRELVLDGQPSWVPGVVTVAAVQVREYDALLVATPAAASGIEGPQTALTDARGGVQVSPSDLEGPYRPAMELADRHGSAAGYLR